jgi:hypothetical protein
VTFEAVVIMVTEGSTAHHSVLLYMQQDWHVSITGKLGHIGEHAVPNSGDTFFKGRGRHVGFLLPEKCVHNVRCVMSDPVIE